MIVNSISKLQDILSQYAIKLALPADKLIDPKINAPRAIGCEEDQMFTPLQLLIMQTTNTWPSYLLRLDGGTFINDSTFLFDPKSKNILKHPSVDTLFHWEGAWDKRYHDYSAKEEIKYFGRSLLLAGTWDVDFYHFYCETLSRLAIVNYFDIKLNEFDQILISKTEPPFVQTWLDILGVRSKAIAVTPNAVNVCQELYVPSLCSVTGNLTTLAIDFIKSKIEENCFATQDTLHDSIFVVRGRSKNGRQLLNENQVYTEIYQPLGYHLVNPGAMTVIEQAKLFKNAKNIAAPHGAALTNLIFCENKPNVIEFFGSDYKNNCFYNIVEKKYGSYRYHISKNIDGKSNYSIDLDKLKEEH